MPENPIFEALFTIHHKILEYSRRLIPLLDFFLSDEDCLKSSESASFIKHIQKGNLMLQQDVDRLLGNKLTNEEFQNIDLESHLSKVRHDLKNPINSMQGYAEISLEEFQLINNTLLCKKMEEIISLIHEILVAIEGIKINASTPSEAGNNFNTIIRANLDTFSTVTENTTEEFLKFKNEIPILVVDDIEENCKLLTLYLNHIGYNNIHVAYNGNQALEYIESNPVEIILLDIDMPGLSGIEVLITIKKHARLRHIMAIMISAADSMENTINCIKIGAEDFLPKPFNRDLLNVRIGSCVEKKWFQNVEIEYNKKIEIEKQRYETLLNVILPPSIVEELTVENKVATKNYKNVAVLFIDVVSFTTYCDTHDLADVEVNLQKFSELCENIGIKYNLQKIKTIGDAFLATAGMLIENENPVLDCLRCASELLENSVKLLPAKWKLRAGIDFGSVIGGIIGHRQFLFDIWGDTVNTASRVQNAAEPNSIFLTKNALDQLQNVEEFESHGIVMLKGKTPMELFKYKG